MTETLATIEMAQGEGKRIKLTITRNGSPVDMTDKSCRFVAKQNYEDTSYLIEKSDSDFDKTEASSGIVYFNIVSGESLVIEPDTYMANFKAVISGEAGEDVDIRRNIELKIRDSLFHD